MGLRVALDKTKALWMHGRGRKPPADTSHLSIRGIRVEIGTSMKYLGIYLDSH